MRSFRTSLLTVLATVLLATASSALAYQVLQPANPAPTTRRPQLWAVLVAIDHYEAGDDVIPPCPGAIRDLSAVRTWLQRQGGWPGDHILLMDRDSQRTHGGPLQAIANLYPSRANLSWALRSWLPAHARPGDIVLVYFAGQAVGLPAPEIAPPGTPERTYLLPIDADLNNIDATGWSIPADLDGLAAAGQNPVFVWLDTSLSGRGQPVFDDLEPPDAGRWLATVARWPSVSAWLSAVGRPSAEGGREGRQPVRRGPDRRPRYRRDPSQPAGLSFPDARRPGPGRAGLPHLRRRAGRGDPLGGRPGASPCSCRPNSCLRQGHSDRVLDLALTPDGATIASAGADSTVKLWRAADRALLRTLPNHFVGVTQVAISPDGTRLASGDGAGRVWVYALPEFRVLTTRSLQPHGGPVTALEFLDDGDTLATLDARGKRRSGTSPAARPSRLRFPNRPPPWPPAGAGWPWPVSMPRPAAPGSGPTTTRVTRSPTCRGPVESSRPARSRWTEIDWPSAIVTAGSSSSNSTTTRREPSATSGSTAR